MCVCGGGGGGGGKKSALYKRFFLQNIFANILQKPLATFLHNHPNLLPHNTAF